MIEILNKLINIVVGTSEVGYILDFSNLKFSYQGYLLDFLYELQSGFEGSFSTFEPSKLFNIGTFFGWFFSHPNVIMSFIFYCMITYGIIFFFIIVPFRLIKQLLPRSVRTRKGTNKA